MNVVTTNSSDIDLWTDDALRDPYAALRTLREAGAAVWLERFSCYAITRYADVKRVLGDDVTFVSGNGVALTDTVNNLVRGTLLTSDGERHTKLLRIIGAPLSADAVRGLRVQLVAEAERVVERVVAKRSFDGVTELAWHLPLIVVSNLVGLPEAGRERMLVWASAVFDVLGPAGVRMDAAAPVFGELTRYIAQVTVPGALVSGSWGDRLIAAETRGEITHDECMQLMITYITPSLDTTINGLSNALWLFAQHPDQWDLVRERPSRINGAISEALRLESPVQYFTRSVARDTAIDGIAISAGSRVLVCYGSANRDERAWNEPERFDVLREARDQLAFGHGAHECLGMPLARLEMHSIFTALAKRVARFTVRSATRALNNSLRGFQHLPTTVTTVGEQE